MKKERLEKLYNVLEKENLDGFFSTNPSTVQYFTGVITNRYPPRIAYFLSIKEKAYIIAPSLEFEQTKFETKICEVIEWKTNQKIIDIISKIIKNKKRIGIEESFLSKNDSEQLEKKGFKLKNIQIEIAKIRAIKDLEEIENIKKAIEITEKTLGLAKELIKEGKYSEKEIAKECLISLLKNGCEWFSFEPIVATGKNSSFPHAVATNNKIEKNTFTIVDIGGKFGSAGYCADLTRTFICGEINKEKEINFEIVKETVNEVINNLKDKVIAKEIDSIARKCLAQKKLDKYFIHGLGHGIGLDVHEYPRINSTSDIELKEGMVVTVEPGIYFKNKYGIRLEQDVLIKKNKAEILSKFPLDY